MKRILKYRLTVTDSQRILIPSGSVPISVGYQDHELSMWVLVPQEQDIAMADVEDMHHLTIRIFGTGHEVEHSDRLVFIATMQDHMTQLVWHVFYELRVD